MIEYRTRDRTRWPQGPWSDEPDKRQWTYGGRACLIVRGPLGQLCGYASVEPEHPLFGVESDDERLGELRVHGGITYAAGCSHGDQSTSICHVPEEDSADDVWWLGFDCGHLYDRVPGMSEWCFGDQTYRDLAYVVAEVERLADQL